MTDYEKKMIYYLAKATQIVEKMISDKVSSTIGKDSSHFVFGERGKCRKEEDLCRIHVSNAIF
jgi:hypothetical protein